MTKNNFIEQYVNPFLDSWNNIKSDAVQYMCRQLRNIERGEKPLDLTIDNKLCYFLIDDGDMNGGMFLASAYENFIQWQNQFIDDIINKNNLGGILNSYISQLQIEINIQDAEENEIINIDNNTYSFFEELISSCSIRNIFNINDKQIYYKNYNDIKYNYDLIEENLAKLILPGIKRFKKNKYKFITYMYEGFRGQNSSVLIQYNDKYTQSELTEEEKNYINKSLKKINNDKKIYNDIFSSLQILMKEILKENYEQKYLLYDIIQKIPKYVILNEELIKLIENRYNKSKNSFTINSLVSIFEYFEELCWEDIKKYIPEDFKTSLDRKILKDIIHYFENNKNNEKQLIDNILLTKAIRKLISRYIVGTRQETDIKPEIELKLHIIKTEFWPKNIIDDIDTFTLQIEEIFKTKINIAQSLDLYNSLKGDENQLKISNISNIVNKQEEKKRNNKEPKKIDLMSLKSINSEINRDSYSRDDIEEEDEIKPKKEKEIIKNEIKEKEVILERNIDKKKEEEYKYKERYNENINKNSINFIKKDIINRIDNKNNSNNDIYSEKSDSLKSRNKMSEVLTDNENLDSKSAFNETKTGEDKLSRITKIETEKRRCCEKCQIY